MEDRIKRRMTSGSMKSGFDARHHGSGGDVRSITSLDDRIKLRMKSRMSGGK
jgi:hypothetical protein